MTTNTELIVLHLTKFGENSVVLHTLSREYGRRGFLVRGVGKKPMASLFLPLTVLEADITESGRSNLFTARNLTAKYPLNGIRSSLYKNTMTLFISEVLYRTVKEGGNEPGLFDWCEKSILTLDSIESDFSNFHIRFLLELAVALGFSPDTEDLMPFTGERFPVVKRFMQEPFAESMLIPLTGDARNEIAEGILRYIEYHSESAVNIRSLKVLSELYR